MVKSGTRTRGKEVRIWVPVGAAMPGGFWLLLLPGAQGGLAVGSLRVPGARCASGGAGEQKGTGKRSQPWFFVCLRAGVAYRNKQVAPQKHSASSLLLVLELRVGHLAWQGVSGNKACPSQEPLTLPGHGAGSDATKPLKSPGHQLCSSSDAASTAPTGCLPQGGSRRVFSPQDGCSHHHWCGHHGVFGTRRVFGTAQLVAKPRRRRNTRGRDGVGSAPPSGPARRGQREASGSGSL